MRRASVLVVGLVLGLAACGNDDSATSSTSEATTTVLPVTTTSVPVTTTASPVTDDNLEATGVLFAALLLMAGDPEAAVASGVVSPSEVDAAAEALETGSLDSWVDAAQRSR